MFPEGFSLKTHCNECQGPGDKGRDYGVCLGVKLEAQVPRTVGFKKKHIIAIKEGLDVLRGGATALCSTWV